MFSSRKFAIVALSAIFAGVGISSAQAEKKEKLTKEQLPANIAAKMKQDFPDAEFVEIEKEVEGEDPGQFDLVIRSGGKTFELEFSADGELKEKKEIQSNEEDEGEKDSETSGSAEGGKGEKKWTDSFNIEKRTFSSTGRNRYFILEPGYQIVLQSPDEKNTITVLDETLKIGDVETRVVEEREEEEGKLKEVSRNFFAICKQTGDVFYFGEEVDMYKDGKIHAHSGAWRADEKDSKAGILMPGQILLGARHYQEISPNAKDRAEVIADDLTRKTPAGEFKNCLHVKETSALDPKDLSIKYYAPEVGMIQDEDMVLVKYGKATVTAKKP